jgi:hypothetical protein
LVVSLLLAAHSVLHRIEKPAVLLRSAVSLWISNVLVFSGGAGASTPAGRTSGECIMDTAAGAFLFPQMLLSRTDLAKQGMANWEPSFVDYLFLAFNFSTALSPTDTPVLTAWANVLLIVHSLISLSIIAFIAARAVGIL